MTIWTADLYDVQINSKYLSMLSRRACERHLLQSHHRRVDTACVLHLFARQHYALVRDVIFLWGLVITITPQLSQTSL